LLGADDRAVGQAERVVASGSGKREGRFVDGIGNRRDTADIDRLRDDAVRMAQGVAELAAGGGAADVLQPVAAVAAGVERDAAAAAGGAWVARGSRPPGRARGARGWARPPRAPPAVNRPRSWLLMVNVSWPARPLNVNGVAPLTPCGAPPLRFYEPLS